MTSASQNRKLRCAIYTRKSTEEGLEQAFNSLDAQHEACSAYILSQASLGWVLVAKRYDDGGISGGTLARPALQELLADIRQGDIDVVVVYKIDRLTRSLTDFAKIVDVFDAGEVSFVSVTQQFNITTSMGRLTLNVLLSFAQFEREVTAERIRDKIAASKKKGMWMGGAVPLGYVNREKKLQVDPVAARVVERIFRRYLELGSVRKVKEELEAKQEAGLDPAGKGGTSLRCFSRGHLYWLLSNPVYVGDIRHKGKIMPGQHEAIVPRALWEEVQAKLKDQTRMPGGAPRTPGGSLLTGLLFDETGRRITPTHSRKAGLRYRYYVSLDLMGRRVTGTAGWRLRAHDLEEAILNALRLMLRDEDRLYRALALQEVDAQVLVSIGHHADRLARSLQIAAVDARRLVPVLVQRIEIAEGQMRLFIARHRLLQELGVMNGFPDENGDPHHPDDVHVLTLPFDLRRRSGGMRLIIGGDVPRPVHVDHGLVETLCRARRCLAQLTSGEHETVASLARTVGVDDGEISRVLPLAFLAPYIVESILKGTQPTGLTVRKLLRLKPLPLLWSEQCRALGFDAV